MVLFLRTVFQTPVLSLSYILNVHVDVMELFEYIQCLYFGFYYFVLAFFELIFQKIIFLSVWFLFKFFLLTRLSFSLRCRGVFLINLTSSLLQLIVAEFTVFRICSPSSSLIVSSFLWVLNLLLKYHYYNLVSKLLRSSSLVSLL